MQVRTKLEIRRQTDYLIGELKRCRWITSGEVKLPNKKILLAHQKSDGSIGLALIGNSRADQIRRKKIEDMAQKYTWAWRCSHGMKHRPDLIQEIRDREFGRAKARTKKLGSNYEVRNG